MSNTTSWLVAAATAALLIAVVVCTILLIMAFPLVGAILLLVFAFGFFTAAIRSLLMLKDQDY